MRWTMCTFVKDLATRQIVWHRVWDWDSAVTTGEARVAHEEREANELARTWPRERFDLFVQGFDSAESLYGAWPELRPQQSAR